jgi:Xaa-Pro dipeptidase
VDRESKALKALYLDHVQACARTALTVAQRHGFDGLLLHSGRVLPKSRFDDQDHPFRVLPMAAYFAPTLHPGSFLLLRPGRRAELFLPRKTDFWEDPAEAIDASIQDAFDVCLDKDPVGRAASACEHHRVAVLTEDPESQDGLPIEDDQINPRELIAELNEIRTRKTDYEIACLAHANRLAVPGHLAVRSAFFEGERSELALHLLYLQATAQDDSETPYKNIIALGRSGAVLHHIKYQTRTDARSLLIDAGATYRGYNSDITRTYVADDNTQDSPIFRNLVSRMERLQESVIQLIETNLPYETLHDIANGLLSEVLVDVGIFRGSASDAVDLGVTRGFFPHGLGHHLGIQVHDVAGLPSSPRPENRWLRNTRTIQPRQVFTIEPGLYFIDHLIDALRVSSARDKIDFDLVDRLHPFGGIRIEDNILVLAEDAATKTRNLTREAFATTGESTSNK